MDLQAVIFADQPLYAPGVGGSGVGDGEGGEPRGVGGGGRDSLEKALRSEAVRLSELLRVPMLWWRECARPSPVADADGESSGREEEEKNLASSSRRASTTAGGRPCLIEVDGEAPLVYSNLAGLVERGHARRAVLAEVR